MIATKVYFAQITIPKTMDLATLKTLIGETSLEDSMLTSIVEAFGDFVDEEGEKKLSASEKFKTLMSTLSKTQTEKNKALNDIADLNKKIEELGKQKPEGDPKPQEKPDGMSEFTKQINEMKSLIEGLQNQIKTNNEASLREKIMGNIRNYLASNNCTNDVVRDLALEKYSLPSDASVDKSEEYGKSVLESYNTLYKKLYGDSISPVFNPQSQMTPPPASDNMFDDAIQLAINSGILPQKSK